MLGFLRKILKKFFIPVRKEYFLKTESPAEFKYYLDLATRRELARLEAEVERLRSQNVQLKKVIEQLRKGYDKKLVEKAKKQEREIKRREKEATLPWVWNFFGVQRPKVCSFDGYKPFKFKVNGKVKTFKYLAGVELEEVDGNTVIKSLLLAEKPNEKDVRKMGRVPCGLSFVNYPYIFSHPHNLMNELKLGLVTLNITPDGRFVPPKIEVDSDVDENEIKSKEIKRMAEIDTKMLEGAPPELRNLILSLYKRIEDLESEKREAMKSEQRAIIDKLDAETAAEVHKENIDRLTSQLESALRTVSTLADSLQETKMMEIRARMKQAILEDEVRALWEALEEKIEQMKGLGADEKEKLLQELKRDMRFVTDRVIETLGVAQGLTPVIKKGEEK